jgi:trans-aconitate 2-methyltransferase
MSTHINADWNATNYDNQPLPHETWGPLVINRCRLRGTESVIDAGCGTGRDAITAARLIQERSLLTGRDLGGRIHAFDLNPSMLDRAAERFAVIPERWRPTLSAGNAMDPWPVTDADVAYTVATFHWVTDHNLAFKHAAAALKPGGRFVGECGGFGNISTAVNAAERVDPTYVRPAWNFATVEATACNLEEAGFTVEDVRLRAHPVIFLNADAAYDYLRTIVLHAMGEEELREVAATMGDTLDYVRLEWESTKQ